MSAPERRCGSCRWFRGQTFPKKPGWRHAAGRCEWPPPAEVPLPDSITRSISGRALGDLNRMKTGVWPDFGKDCPCWEPVP